MRLSSRLNVCIRSLIEISRLPSIPLSVLYPRQIFDDHGPHRPFGENQLSPSSIGILPLTTGHPNLLQQKRVRASPCISTGLTLPMVSSLGFGSPNTYYKRPIQTWFPYDSIQNGLSQSRYQELAGSFFNRHDITELDSALSACPQTVSCSISWALPAFFSPFPHGTRSLSVYVYI